MKTRASCAALVLAAVGCCFSAPGQVEPFADGVRGAPAVAEKPGRAPLSSLLGVRLVNVPAVTLAPFNNDLAVAEDSVNDWGGRFRISVPRDVAFDWRAGQWINVAGGGMLWVLDVVSPNAYGVRLHVQGMNLPEGVEATVYSPLHPETAPWPMSGTGKHGGEFWVPTSYGDRARIEVFVPAHVQVNPANPMLWVDQVQHLYRDPLTGRAGPVSEELGCHIDVTCQAGWANDALGVARMYFVDGGGFVCSGSLLNSLASDWTPYFLTAAHCFNTQAVADTLETYWRFQTTTCNAAAPALPAAVNDATLLATGVPSDFTFLMIEGTIDRSLWWEGWDANVFGNGLQATGIHHPGGTYKRWSQGTTSTFANTCAVTGITSRVTGTFASGVTEGGSSGSPLFDSAHRVRGSLSCGNASCGAQSERRFHYGRFETTYPNISGLLDVGSDDAREENDSCAAANVFAPPAPGTLTSFGRIVKSVDEDWYQISIPAYYTLNVTATFTHAWGDIDMLMYDTCGGTLLRSSAGVTGTETFSYQNPNGFADTVFVRVYLFSDTRNTYTFSGQLVAPPVPANNACASATTVTTGLTTGSNIAATNDGQTTCGGSSATTGLDVWYRFVPTCTGTYVLDTEGTPSESIPMADTVISVHSACPGTAANTIACDDDAGTGFLSRIETTLSQGVAYYVRVTGYGGGQGNFRLNITGPAYPSNDVCVSAIPLTTGVSQAYSTCSATSSPPLNEPSCFFFGYDTYGPDIWYSWTAGVTGTATASTCGSTHDNKIAVYAACPGAAGATLACNDDFCGLQTQVSWSSVAGQSYIIRLGGWNQSRGSGLITVTEAGTAGCDDTDFNNDGLFPDTADIDDFLSVFSGGPCSTGLCGDIDFNNDGLYPDTTDIDALLSVFSGGPCF